MYLHASYIHSPLKYSSPKRTLWICQTPSLSTSKKNDRVAEMVPAIFRGLEGPTTTNYLLLGPESLVELIREDFGWMLKYQQHEIFTVNVFLVHTCYVFCLGEFCVKLFGHCFSAWVAIKSCTGFKVPGREVSVDVHQLDIPKHIPKSAIHLYQNQRLHHNTL